MITHNRNMGHRGIGHWPTHSNSPRLSLPFRYCCSGRLLSFSFLSRWRTLRLRDSKANGKETHRIQGLLTIRCYPSLLSLNCPQAYHSHLSKLKVHKIIWSECYRIRIKGMRTIIHVAATSINTPTNHIDAPFPLSPRTLIILMCAKGWSG